MKNPIKQVFTRMRKYATTISSKLNSVSLSQFPNEGFPIPKIKDYLIQRRNELGNINSVYSLGTPKNLPNPIAIYAWKMFIDLNPNNIGESLENKYENLSGTRKLEYEVINFFAQLYHSTRKEVSGYFTSGSTEGILFSLWAAKKSLIKRNVKNAEKIYVLKTPLTHSAINKAADILDLKTIDIPVTQKSWIMSTFGLKKTLDKLYYQGVNKYVLIPTAGYTSSGGVDDIKNLKKVLSNFLAGHPDIDSRIILDAAFGGLTIPITNPNSDLNMSNCDFIVTDLHKMGGVPYPCGVIIYKKKFRDFVLEKNPYLKTTYASLLGSRPGTSAASAWATIMFYGKHGLHKIFTRSISLKEELIAKIKDKNSKYRIITSKNLNSFALVIPQRFTKKFTKKFLLKFGLTPITYNFELENGEKNKYTLFQIYIMPHFKRQYIDEFIQGLP